MPELDCAFLADFARHRHIGRLIAPSSPDTVVTGGRFRRAQSTSPRN